MKKLFIIVMLLCTMLIFAAGEEDPLWQKAVAVAEDNMDWVPGEMLISISALDDNGNEMMTSDLMFSFEEEDGEIVSYYDGGKRSGDLIPENDQMVQQFLMQDMTPDKSTIFYNNGTWNLKLKRLETQEEMMKQQCTVFSYTCELPGENNQSIPAEGKIWLNSESGIPVYQEQIMQPPVDMVEEINNKITYSYHKGDFTVKNLKSITSVNAMGQKAKMKNEIDFKKYWRYENSE